MNYFQEDLDGSSLFNIADFFQSKECASHFGGLYFAGSLHSDKQVIEDSLGANGDVQLALAAFLKEFAGQDAQFYVDSVQLRFNSMRYRFDKLANRRRNPQVRSFFLK